MRKMSKTLVYISVLVSMIFWSFSFLWYKDIYHYLTPFTTIFFRLVISSILLLIVSASIGKLKMIRKTDIGKMLLLSFFEPFLYFIGESKGMEVVTPTTASVIISVIPLIVPVFAYLILKEKITIKNMIGIVISFSGVLLVIVNDQYQITASPLGIFLLSLSILAAVFYTIMLKRLTEIYNPFTIITWQNSLGVLYFLPLVLIFDIKSWNTHMFNVNAAIPLLKLAVLASSLAFIFYANSVRRIGAVKTNIFTNLIPVFTAFLSFWLLKEKLHLHNLLGIILVVSGLILSQIPPIKNLRRQTATKRSS